VVVDLSSAALLFSLNTAQRGTLVLSGNGSKWRPLGRGSTLYNQAPATQRADTPQRLSGANHSDPTVWHPQRLYHPTALSDLTANWQ
jgi:hypothetical protein